MWYPFPYTGLVVDDSSPSDFKKLSTPNTKKIFMKFYLEYFRVIQEVA